MDSASEQSDNSHRTPYSSPPEVFHHGSYAQNAQLFRRAYEIEQYIYEIEQYIRYQQEQADAEWTARCAYLREQGYDAAC